MPQDATEFREIRRQSIENPHHFVQRRLELAPRLGAVIVEGLPLAPGHIRTETPEDPIVCALEGRERRARANRALAGEAGQQRMRREQPAAVHAVEVRTTRQRVVDVELDDDEIWRELPAKAAQQLSLVCGFSKLCRRISLNSVASWGIWN